MGSTGKTRYAKAYGRTLSLLTLVGIISSLFFEFLIGGRYIIVVAFASFLQLLIISILNILYLIPVKSDFFQLVLPGVLFAIAMIFLFEGLGDLFIFIIALPVANLILGIFWFFKFNKHTI
jgi:hypothetical protein